MAVTRAQVRVELNASEATVPDAKIDSELAVAAAQVNKYLGGPDAGTVPDPLPVPEAIYDKALLLVTVEAINQSLAPNGVLNQVYDAGAGDLVSTPVRIGRDPLKPAYPVLGPLDEWKVLLRMSAADANDRVLVYYLSPGQVAHEFCQSLLEMSIYDLMTSRHLAGVFGVRSGALLAAARNSVVTQFLESDVADWLLFIDSDMTFERDALEYLFTHADPETCPIIGGLCFGLDYVEGPFPVVYKLVDTPDGPMTHRPARLDQDTGLMNVDGTGSAFLMIHRSVLTTMRDKEFSKAYPWFQETELGGGHPVGEDITFCLRARTLGYPIVINLDLRIGHKKDQIVIGTPPKAQVDEDRRIEPTKASA